MLYIMIGRGRETILSVCFCTTSLVNGTCQRETVSLCHLVAHHQATRRTVAVFGNWRLEEEVDKNVAGNVINPLYSEGQ